MIQRRGRYRGRWQSLSPSLSTSRLLAGSAIIALLATTVSPSARADGGTGGRALRSVGGVAGVTSTTTAGGNGGNGPTFGAGGGGGGAGATGGTGGHGAGGSAGGGGGATPGANGLNGGNTTVSGVGGGGGGGGAHGAVETGATTVSSALAGGTGGTGGSAVGTPGSGGGGGAGGYGVVMNGSDLTLTVNTGATVSGGNGGAGGPTRGTADFGGNGGAGGIGADFLAGGVLINSGSVTGGNGGAGGAGTSGGINGTAGIGGVGVIGAGLTIINSGRIAGGTGNGGQANAITFSGGTNSLTLQSGYSISGNVVAFSSADTLALGGGADASFDTSQIGASAQYRGFGVFQKTGSSTWTLTNTTTTVTPWTITGGTLNVGSDGALGASSGALTLNGGALQWGASFNLANTRSVTLGSGGGSFDTNGFDTVIAQSIGGTGALTKEGAGTLTLSDSNSYIGGTTVLAGTLALSGNGSIASSSGLDLPVSGAIFDISGATSGATINDLTGISGSSIALGAKTLTLGTGNSTTFAGTISGSGGSLFKQGTGTLILDGINTYTGGTTINGGTLEVGDATHVSASLAGNVTVGAASTLMGHGTIAGNVANMSGGILSPGGSIGTLTVNGSYTQGVSSTLSIEVSPSAASKLAVGGTATFNGTLALVYDPGVYSAATYNIVHAGSVAGTFTTVNASGSVPSGLTQSIAYTGTDVDLVLTNPAVTPLVVKPTTDTVFGAAGTAALLGGQQANTTLLGHLADRHGGTGSDAIETSLAGTSPSKLAFNGGAMHLSDAVAQLPDAMAQLGGWFRAIGSFTSLSGTDNVSGVDTRGGGFMAGIDRPIAENLTAGLAAGYSRTNLSQHDSESGTIDTPRIAAYGSYVMGPLAFDMTVGYAYDRIGEKRPITGIGTASANHDAHEATGAAQASYRFDYVGFSIMPHAGLTYVHVFDGGLSESGAGGFDLNVMHRNSDSLRPFVAVSAGRPVTTSGGLRLVPEVDIRYSHELFATAPSLVSVGGGNFSVNGLAPSHDLLTVGSGITAAMSDRLAFFADYDATLPTGNYWQQTISAGARYKF